MAQLNIFHYSPGTSPLHRMDPRIKLGLLVGVSVAVNLISGTWGLTLIGAFLVIAVGISGLPLRVLIRELRHYGWIILLILGGYSLEMPIRPSTAFPFLGINLQGLLRGILIVWRLTMIMILGLIVIGTTPSGRIRDTLEWLFGLIPIFPAARIGMMFSLTISLIPVVFDQAAEVLAAQQARCVELRKNPAQRISLFVRPFVLRVLARADEMALALEARCFSDHRTRPEFRLGPVDGWILLLTTTTVVVAGMLP